MEQVSQISAHLWLTHTFLTFPVPDGREHASAEEILWQEKGQMSTSLHEFVCACLIDAVIDGVCTLLCINRSVFGFFNLFSICKFSLLLFFKN